MNFISSPIKWGLYSSIAYPTIYFLFDHEKKKNKYHPIVYSLNMLVYSINGFCIGFFSCILINKTNINSYLKQIS